MAWKRRYSASCSITCSARTAAIKTLELIHPWVEAENPFCHQSAVAGSLSRRRQVGCDRFRDSRVEIIDAYRDFKSDLKSVIADNYLVPALRGG